jgi:hypothetical protein
MNTSQMIYRLLYRRWSCLHYPFGATTFLRMTTSHMTFSIIVSYAGHGLFTVLLNVILETVILRSVFHLNVVAPSFLVLDVIKKVYWY